MKRLAFLLMHSDMGLEAYGYFICSSETEKTSIIMVPFLKPCYRELTYSQWFPLSFCFGVLNFVCSLSHGVHLFTLPTDCPQLKSPFIPVHTNVSTIFFWKRFSHQPPMLASVNLSIPMTCEVCIPEFNFLISSAGLSSSLWFAEEIHTMPSLYIDRCVTWNWHFHPFLLWQIIFISKSE